MCHRAIDREAGTGPAAARRGLQGACALALALVLAAQVGAVPVAEGQRPRVVTVVARDFAFEMPASIPAGVTTFRLLNRGKQLHHLSLVRLDEGKTATDGLNALIAAGRGVRPAWMHSVGGPNAAMPGAGNTVTLLLEPGSYLAYCEVPGPDPAPHFMKGMVKGFTVVSAPPGRAVATLPATDVSVSLTDYDFVFSPALTSGRHSIAVTNTGKQPHMMVMAMLPPGVSIGDFLDWSNDPRGRLSPGRVVGGVSEMAPGLTAVLQGNFAPGRYGLVCFSADQKDGKPHFMHGMQREIQVR